MNKFSVFIPFIFLLGVSCKKNVFEESANKNAPDAILFQAEQAIDSRDYPSAITLIASLPIDYKNRRNVQFLNASAYAGQCGLNFIDFVSWLSTASMDRFFATLMTQFHRSTPANINSCYQAEQIIRGVEPLAGNRTADENFLMAFVSLTKIGAIFNTYADTNNDDAVDPSFDACTAVSIADQDVADVATGITNISESLSAAGSSIAGATTASFGAICTDPTLSAICKSDRTSFSAGDLKLIRTAIVSRHLATLTDQWVGLGTCNNVLASCFCP